jgi:hypothetical protein
MNSKFKVNMIARTATADRTTIAISLQDCRSKFSCGSISCTCFVRQILRNNESHSARFDGAILHALLGGDLIRNPSLGKLFLD